MIIGAVGLHVVIRGVDGETAVRFYADNIRRHDARWLIGGETSDREVVSYVTRPEFREMRGEYLVIVGDERPFRPLVEDVKIETIDRSSGSRVGNVYDRFLKAWVRDEVPLVRRSYRITLRLLDPDRSGPLDLEA